MELLLLLLTLLKKMLRNSKQNKAARGLSSTRRFVRTLLFFAMAGASPLCRGSAWRRGEGLVRRARSSSRNNKWRCRIGRTPSNRLLAPITQSLLTHTALPPGSSSHHGCVSVDKRNKSTATPRTSAFRRSVSSAAAPSRVPRSLPRRRRGVSYRGLRRRLRRVSADECRLVVHVCPLSPRRRALLLSGRGGVVGRAAMSAAFARLAVRLRGRWRPYCQGCWRPRCRWTSSSKPRG